jgi:hypothetical protein
LAELQRIRRLLAGCDRFYGQVWTAFFHLDANQRCFAVFRKRAGTVVTALLLSANNAVDILENNKYLGILMIGGCNG